MLVHKTNTTRLAFISLIFALSVLLPSGQALGRAYTGALQPTPGVANSAQVRVGAYTATAALQPTSTIGLEWDASTGRIKLTNFLIRPTDLVFEEPPCTEIMCLEILGIQINTDTVYQEITTYAAEDGRFAFDTLALDMLYVVHLTAAGQELHVPGNAQAQIRFSGVLEDYGRDSRDRALLYLSDVRFDVYNGGVEVTLSDELPAMEIDITFSELSFSNVEICRDADEDGYGSPASTNCTYPEWDCDDSNPDSYPGAGEICDGKDNNCNGTVDEEPQASASCVNDVFCDGEEFCSEGACVSGDVPCPDDEAFCNGTESCDEELQECGHAGDPCPDDELFCNGAESCNEETDMCESSGDPCPDDTVFCNGLESCSEEMDACVHSGDPCPDDELFCNGTESCNEETDICESSGDPCPDDEAFCNGTESCNEETDACESSGDPCPDDEVFCNGTESCNEETDACESSGDPCAPDENDCTEESCNEEEDACASTCNAENCQDPCCKDPACETSPTCLCQDKDQDGFGLKQNKACSRAGTDCDDNNASVHPGAEEICDGLDNQCNPEEPGYCRIDEGGICAFGLLSPGNGQKASGPPMLKWSASGYDYFKVYLIAPVNGSYRALPMDWNPCTALDLRAYGSLWQYVDQNSWCAWLVLGVNTSTGKWATVGPWYFRKDAP